MQDAGVEARLEQVMTAMMADNQAPPEAFTRIGLTSRRRRPQSGRRQMNPGTLRPKLGDLRQIASVREIVLDDGQERGVRALAFSTGGGLDFWVLADRSLDIGPLWYRGSPVAWQSPSGFRSPALHDPEGDGGQGLQPQFFRAARHLRARTHPPACEWPTPAWTTAFYARPSDRPR